MLIQLSKSGTNIIGLVKIKITPEDKQPKHFIPEGEWNLNNFEEFLVKKEFI